jgi:NDP-sugar pyrophosphorylase family protein
MKAVILAGGLGQRLMPFTKIIPKPLLPIGEKSVLEIQLERLKMHGFKKIYLATNYKSEYIENYFRDNSPEGVTMLFSRENKPLGTAGPLLKEQLDEPFVVMNGDILSLIDFGKLYGFAREKDTVLTVAIKQMIIPFNFGNIFFEGDYVTGIEEKPNIETYVLSGIYVMKPDIFRHIPGETYYGMDDLIKDLIQKKIPVSKYQMHEYWLDIGNIESFTEAEDIYNKYFKGGQ